jgi:hypothetical protein
MNYDGGHRRVRMRGARKGEISQPHTVSILTACPAESEQTAKKQGARGWPTVFGVGEQRSAFSRAQKRPAQKQKKGLPARASLSEPVLYMRHRSPLRLPSQAPNARTPCLAPFRRAAVVLRYTSLFVLPVHVCVYASGTRLYLCFMYMSIFVL